MSTAPSKAHFLVPALDALDGTCPAAGTLFRACAFLSSDDIPVWLFAGGVDELPAPLPQSSRQRAEAFWALARCLLVRWTAPDAVSIDPGLQAAVRERLLGEERRSWAAGVVRLLAGAFLDASDGVSARRRSARLVPHALAITDSRDAAETEPLATSWLLESAAAHEQGRRRAVSARRLLERSVAVVEHAYGPGDPAVARSVANLALVLQDTGDLDEACRHFERALAIGESAYGAHHPEVGAHLGNLAIALHDRGELPRARACLERALEIALAAGGPEHPTLVGVLTNLGAVLGDLGDVGGASAAFERAATIAEVTLGPGHPVLRSIRANQAQLSRTPGTTG